ncbi:MAG: bifunctional diguanylate cyclase/phosphodiesterase [Pseudomonadota bacterium]
MRKSEGFGSALPRIAAAIDVPRLMATLPTLVLAIAVLSVQFGALALLLALPLVLLPFLTVAPDVFHDGGILSRKQMTAALDSALRTADATGRSTGCLVVQVDDAAALLQRHGHAAQTEVMTQIESRLATALRDSDALARLEPGRFAIALGPVRRLDMESLVQMAARVQAIVTPPIALDAGVVCVTCSVGFCPADRVPRPTGRAVLDAALLAAAEAQRHGPGTIRAYSPDIARRSVERDVMRDRLEQALDLGEIRPHFQPQLSTDTGEITAFEALARWHHPQRGVLPPADFLPALEAAGLAARLGEVMRAASLSALADWDRAGLGIPSVAVNFSAAELRDPRLSDRIRWELDRFDLTPARMTVEVLETVVADTGSDVIVANLAALSRLGCGIDLDDFGTGQAAIAHIRRFAVGRIKIDRSFILRVEDDRDQQRMVAAILSLADRLGIGTVAEGVENAAAHAILAQLGCGHVQGYAIARPMPQEAVPDWIASHRSMAALPPPIPQRAVRP